MTFGVIMLINGQNKYHSLFVLVTSFISFFTVLVQCNIYFNNKMFNNDVFTIALKRSVMS